jgi:hypothetical protein
MTDQHYSLYPTLGSLVAVLAGAVAFLFLAVGLDEAFESADAFTRAGLPYTDLGMMALAVAYHGVFAAFGGYVTARTAPDHGARHALAFAMAAMFIEVVMGGLKADMEPTWYALTLAAAVVPAAIIGGRLFSPRRVMSHAMT